METTEATTTPTTTEQPQCWRDFHALMAADTRRVILYGQPGTGKTFAAMKYGSHKTAHRLICTEDMTDADIVGCWQPAREGWAWKEGKAIEAWRNGDRLVIDEIDRASGDVLSVLLAMTDTAGCVYASMPGLAKRAGVSIPEAETAIKCFLSPDPYSRTKDNEGRRIKEIEGGWQLLNYEKYTQAKSREARNAYQREQMRRRRAEAKAHS